MQSPVKTIKELIADNYDLTGALKKGNITFRIGEPKDLTTRFNERSMSFEFDDRMPGVPRQDSLKRFHTRKPVIIDMWIKISPAADWEEWKDHLQAIIDKVHNIVLTNARTATDLNLIQIGPDRNLDQREEDVLRHQIDIVCRYEVN